MRWRAGSLISRPGGGWRHDDPTSKVSVEPAWSVPVAVADVPETGRRVDFVADGGTRDAIAKAAGLAALPRLEAGFDLTRHGADGLRLVGRVRRPSCRIAS